MKKMIVIKKGKERAELTTESPASSYGVPVLRITGAEDIADGDYGPGDVLGVLDVGGNKHVLHAADAVASWGAHPGRTDENDISENCSNGARRVQNRRGRCRHGLQVRKTRDNGKTPRRVSKTSHKGQSGPEPGQTHRDFEAAAVNIKNHRSLERASYHALGPQGGPGSPSEI